MTIQYTYDVDTEISDCCGAHVTIFTDTGEHYCKACYNTVSPRFADEYVGSGGHSGIAFGGGRSTRRTRRGQSTGYTR